MTTSPRARTIFLAVSGALALAVLIASRDVLLPFVLALVVAYVLTPAVRRVEKLKVPRWAAILIVYALTLGSIGVSIQQMVPRLVIEGQGLAAEWPRFDKTMREDLLPALDRKIAAWTGRKIPPTELVADDARPPEKPAPVRVVPQPDGSFDVRLAEGTELRQTGEGVYEIQVAEKSKGISSVAMVGGAFGKLTKYVQEHSMEVLKIGSVVVSGITKGIFNLFMTLMLGGYIILTHERILAFFRSLVSEPAQPSWDRFLHRLDRGLSGVVRGQLMICLVNGVLSAIGFWLFKLKYWPILSVVAAVMSLIPIFGSILSSVPAVAIGLTQSPATAFGVLAWIIGIHQLEANFLNPKIIGDAAKIHPVLVVFSLLVGEHFFQLAGALFAVPCMSIAQTIFLHFREEWMGIRAGAADETPLMTIPPAPALATLVPGKKPGTSVPPPATKPSSSQPPPKTERSADAEAKGEPKERKDAKSEEPERT